MTLETAQRIVREKGALADKEAQAVVRGGMNICETTQDGRTYLWIKVKPTFTDKESSIEAALEDHRKRNYRQFSEMMQSPVRQEKNITPKPINRQLEVDNKKEQDPSIFGRIKKKAVEFLKEIDSIVIE